MKIIEDINDRNQTDTLIKSVIIEAEALVDSLKALRKSTQLNVLGWSVYESGNFFKSSKRINGKIFSIHLGKVFDRKEATEKIKAWELVNLVADPPVEEQGNMVTDQPMEEQGNLVADPPMDIREARMLIDRPFCPDGIGGGKNE